VSRTSTDRSRGVRFLLLLAVLTVAVIGTRADNTAQTLPFSQNWTTTSLITANDNWSGVAGITGYRGDDLTTAVGADPQTVLGDGTNPGVVNVIANQTNPNTLATGGVAEFDTLANPVVALQGSGTADAPFILISVNTLGKSNINISYNLRDVDGSTDNAVQPVALHYRVGSTGTFTNLPGGFVADASSGPSLATLVTPVSVNLPAAVNNQAIVQLRIMTTNATGNDEWIGIDDISVTGSDVPQPTNPTGTGQASPSSVPAGASTLLTVAVAPGTNPASTGLAVQADLTAIGGTNAQQFFDNGTNGDATPGDNVFSFFATVAPATASGGKTLAASISDAQLRNASASIALTVSAPAIVPLPFTQNWSDTSLITANDNWSNVAGIIGYRGDGLTGGTGTDPRTIVADGTNTPVNVIANQTNPDTVTAGGVAEFDGIANPVVALNGSGTADAPFLLISISTLGQSNVHVKFNLRDLDASADDATQQVALQYRLGNSGDFTNLDYVADATAANSATLVTPVDALLPQALENQPLVQLRIITTNANGNDEWVGIDDIFIAVSTAQTNPTGTGAASPNTGVAGDVVLFTVNVSPGLNPTSTGLAVVADLSAIGGSSTQTFFDNGSNGDATPGDKVFSYQTASLAGTTTGLKTLPFSISDAELRTGTGNISYTVQPPPPPLTAIHDLQGPGSTSPFVGQLVTTVGIVTGVKSNGFFIQTPDTDVDNDPNTSEGIQVFGTPIPAGAVAGNLVRVTARVSEFIPAADPGSPPLTELSGSQAQPIVLGVLATGQPLPLPQLVTFSDINTTTGAEPLERFEGMRVRLDPIVAISPTDGFVDEVNASSQSDGVFHAVMQGVPRPFREPGINAGNPLPNDTSPAPANVPRFDMNPERLRIESRGLSGPPIDLATGAVLSNIVGVVDFRFRAYTVLIDPAFTPSVVGSLSAIPVRARSAGEFTVGSFNMERFFDTVNDSGGADEGSETPTSVAFQRRLSKASLAIRNVMRTPDVIGIEEMEHQSTLQAVADKVNADAALAGQTGVNYVAYLEEGNDIGGIDSGFLVNLSNVEVISVTQVGKDTTYTPPGGSPALLNDRPPLVLLANVRLQGYPAFPVTVIVNHLRSLSGADALTADGLRIRTKRRIQAEYLAQLIQARQAANPNERIISVGDYNAFQINDGFVDSIGTIKGTPTPADQVVQASADLVNPNLVDLVDSAPADQRYTFMFDGNAQELDHVLITQNLSGSMAYARNNGDFPEILRNDPNRPERISDHDMVVGYFAINSLPVCSAATPSVASLWPPDSRMVSINVLGVTDPDGGSPSILITSIFQDELTNNENSALTSVDGAGIGADTAQVRAQRGTPRVAGNGRVYHITFTATDSVGGSCLGEVKVSVPPLQNGIATDGGALYDSTIPRIQ
jgi:predicted extracellular nuclease